MSAARDIEQQAAHWLVVREQPGWSADREVVLRAWLNESVAHKAAFWRLEAGWTAADRLAAMRGSEQRPAPLQWVSAPVWAIAASILLVCMAVLSLWHLRSGSADSSMIRVATGIGGRRQVALTDGSAVTINTASALRASFANGRRRVWLDRGEAFFEVAHDKRHPFVVFAGGRQVTVLGTKFSVRRDGDTVTVAVVEGRVRVEDSDTAMPERAAIITAGDVAIVRGRSMLLADRSEQRVQDALTWRRGVLTFDQVTLEQAAHEFNRYNSRQIRLGNAQAARLRIGGSFEATNVDAFTRLLHDAFGLTVITDHDGVTIKS
ncbi:MULTISPECIES: FecR family protein [unclassified Sphingomonas]|jgi:transmembrane sensor|uniref:FecR family protein n=1 Tax=unclassified Sphingomonas TaxID=196159 RepID=UPI000E10D91C|nr:MULTISPECIES: FecR domain-containing protein [unclassified Sphingomonas]AXJ96125.1 iron dicitrate transport regulator FecR [Sphingomonas sp. FARSPH]